MSLNGINGTLHVGCRRNAIGFKIKKYIPYLALLIVVASVQRFFWVHFHQPTPDLIWYLDSSRAIQYTLLGFDKRNVSLLIDQFTSFESRLWVSSFMSGLMFSLAAFSSNGNLGFRQPDAKVLIIFLLLILNIYFIQLDMHLWRQQLAFYGFVVAVNQRRIWLKYGMAALAIFFHEVAIFLFGVYFFSGCLSRIISSAKFLRSLFVILVFQLAATGIFLGYFQVAVVSLFCCIIMLVCGFEKSILKNCVFVVLLSFSGLFGVAFASSFSLGEASVERLVFLAIMSGVFIFFNTTALPRTTRMACSRPSGVIPAKGFTFTGGSLLNAVLYSSKFGFLVYYIYASVI